MGFNFYLISTEFWKSRKMLFEMHCTKRTTFKKAFCLTKSTNWAQTGMKAIINIWKTSNIESWNLIKLHKTVTTTIAKTTNIT